jgi:hypothetical protein
MPLMSNVRRAINMSTPRTWLANAESLRDANPTGFAISRTYKTLLRFVQENQWSGACHAVSAVMHVLLRAQRVDSSLYIWEVGFGHVAFDHSWIEVDNKVYDAAVFTTLIQSVSFPPVFRGTDLTTMAATELEYGFQSAQGYDPNARMIAQTPVRDYMDAFPNHPKGLLGLALDIAKSSSIPVSAGALRKAAEQSVWSERA